MTEFDTRARAEALHLHGLVSHWTEVATEAWVALAARLGREAACSVAAWSVG